MIQVLVLSLSLFVGNTPYQNGDIGLKIELPADSAVTATSKNPPFCMISSTNSSNTWHLRLERGIHPSAKNAREALNIQERVGFDVPFVVESRAMMAGTVGGWLHVEQNPGLVESFVIAQFALPTDGDQFILATCRCDPTTWKKSGPMLLQTMQSIVSLDPLTLVQQKLQGLENANLTLESLSKESLTPLLGFHEWRRIQSSGNDIGYALVQVAAGNREEVEIRDGQEELEKTGIIVTVRSRLLLNQATGVVIDSFGRYWLSWDGKESRWSNRVTRWLEKAKATESETGIRNRPEIGSPKSRIIVLQQDLTSDVIKPPFKALAEDPWLPRALVWVLGPFLASHDHDANFIWMTYENTNGQQRVATRTDVLHADAGNWTIETHFGEREVTLWSTFDASGHLLEQEQKNGATVTGTTSEILEPIWQPQNLW